MCVKDGTEVEFHCPILDCAYLNWEPELDYNYYNEEIIALKFNATLSGSHGFEEITCDCSDVDYDGPSYHALLIVTGEFQASSSITSLAMYTCILFFR